MKKGLILGTLLIIITSCTNTEMYEKIAGNWECASWINKKKGTDNCNNNVFFKFNKDQTYASILGTANDSGEYRIQNNLLYVTPSGKMEFAVKITKLNNDTLELLMNQAGNEEILTLVR